MNMNMNIDNDNDSFNDKYYAFKHQLYRACNKLQTINPDDQNYLTDGLLVLKNITLSLSDYWMTQINLKIPHKKWTPNLKYMNNRTILTFPYNTDPKYFDGIYEMDVCVNIITINLLAKTSGYSAEQHFFQILKYLEKISKHMDLDILNSIGFKIYIYSHTTHNFNMTGFKNTKKTKITKLGKDLGYESNEYVYRMKVDKSHNMVFTNISNNQFKPLDFFGSTNNNAFASNVPSNVNNGFTFGAIPQTNNNGFTLGTTPQTNNNGFTLGTTPQTNNNGFTFSTTPQTNNNGFTFGATPQTNNNGFTFGTTPQTNNNGFTFGTTPQTNNNGFTFGATPQTNNNGFTFGATPTNNTNAFNFGVTPTNNTNAFTFGTPSTNNGFGIPLADYSGTNAFGTPNYTFGNQSNANNNVFTFGCQNKEKSKQSKKNDVMMF